MELNFTVERHPPKIWEQLTQVAIEARATLRSFYKVKASYAFPKEETLPSLVLVAKNAWAEPIAAAEAENHGEYLYFYKLGVREKYRRQGASRALMQEAEKLAREWRCLRIELKTVENTGNAEVFSRLGFTETSRSPSPIFVSTAGLPVWEIAMEKTLS